MPRIRFSIAAVGFWVALAAANSSFFVELSRTIGISLVMLAMILALPVLNILVIGLRSLLFGPSRRRAFWLGFEVAGTLCYVALLVTARALPITKMMDYPLAIDRFSKWLFGLSRFNRIQMSGYYGVMLLCLAFIVFCTPILAVAVAAGLATRRRARRSGREVVATEEARVSCGNS